MAFIRIDPSLPVVWRSPRAIQIGGELPRVVIDPVTDREQRMLAAARAGIPSAALAAVGRCSESTARAFLARIRPALESARPEPLGAAVRVRSAARDEIVRAVRALGLIGDTARGRPRVGIVVADHAVPLRAYRDWLRERIPHFAVVYGTESVTVGPVVVPGTTGCLRCADLARRERDPAWPAVAAQLVGQPAAAVLDPVIRTEALCAATRLAAAVVRGVAGVEELPGRRLRRGGGREEVRIAVHPDCGCGLDLQLPLPEQNPGG